MVKIVLDSYAHIHKVEIQKCNFQNQKCAQILCLFSHAGSHRMVKASSIMPAQILCRLTFCAKHTDILEMRLLDFELMYSYYFTVNAMIVT